MRNEALFELAKRWESDATNPVCENGAPEAAIDNAIANGIRQGKRECADMLRMLISILS
jgi:hypothetical protein